MPLVITSKLFPFFGIPVAILLVITNGIGIGIGWGTIDAMMIAKSTAHTKAIKTT